MKLSEVKYECLENGLRVKSLNTGHLGTVVDKWIDERNDEMVRITWDGRNHADDSYLYLHWGNGIEVLLNEV